MAVPREMPVTKEPIFVVEYVADDKQVFTGLYRDRLGALDVVYMRAVELADSTGDVWGEIIERKHPMYSADRGGKPAFHLCDYITNGFHEWFVYPVFFDDEPRKGWK